MRTLWRISNHASLTGEGGLRYAARWHSAGSRIVYLARSPAGAMIEVLVHLELDRSELPRSYTLLQCLVPDIVKVTFLKPPPGEAWKQDLSITRLLGDTWLLQGKTALARVPSAILPNTYNYLLNPGHKSASEIRIAAVTQPSFDLRLFQPPHK